MAETLTGRCSACLQPMAGKLFTYFHPKVGSTSQSCLFTQASTDPYSTPLCTAHFPRLLHRIRGGLTHLRLGPIIYDAHFWPSRCRCWLFRHHERCLGHHRCQCCPSEAAGCSRHLLGKFVTSNIFLLSLCAVRQPNDPLKFHNSVWSQDLF